MPTLQETALAFFQSKGWSKEQAAGIVGNLDYESGLDHTNNKGDNGTAYGIAQWRGDRQTLFYRIFGKPIQRSTYEEQLSFVNYELNNNEKAAGDALKKASNIDDATKTFMNSYERPSDAAKKNSIGERIKLGTQAAGSSANDIINQILQGILAIPTGGLSIGNNNLAGDLANPTHVFDFVKDNVIALAVGAVGLIVVILGAYSIVKSPTDAVLNTAKSAATKFAKG